MLFFFTLFWQNKAGQVFESAKNTASAAHEKASEAVGRSPAETQQCKEENTGVLQQVQISNFYI